jgi:hypothetical protein
MVVNFIISKFFIFRSEKMLSEKQNKTDRKIYIWLFIIAFAVAFSSTYNPLNFRRMHVDSSVYVTITQGIIRGQLPYRDFVDNKGPLTYLLSAPGLLLGGFTGIWITEIILLFITVLFAYKTALFFGDRHKALPGTVFSFVVLLAFFSVNAGTEEYSLPFLMISFFIFTKYYFSPKQNVNFLELIVLGICFACAVLIRLNMFPLWAGFCVVIFIESIIKRRFALLGKYIAGFCLGIVIVFIPVFLYLKRNGIMDDFLAQVVFGGAAKGFSESGLKEIVQNYYFVISRCYSFFPLMFGLFKIITQLRKSDFGFYTAYTFSYLLMTLFLSFSSGDNHYNIVLVPFFIPALVFLVDILYSAFSGIKAKRLILVLFLCFVFSEGLMNYLYDFPKIFFNKSGSQLIKAGKMIDENTGPDDKIISLGFNGYIYPFTQRNAASKFIYQGSGLNYIPGAREKFLSDIMTGKPAIIAVFIAENGISQIMDNWHAPIFEMIDNEYYLLSDDNGFNLFIRNN